MRKIRATVDHVQHDKVEVEAEISGMTGKVMASIPVLVAHTVTPEGFAYAIRMVNPTVDELATFVEGASVLITVKIEE